MSIYLTIAKCTSANGSDSVGVTSCQLLLVTRHIYFITIHRYTMQTIHQNSMLLLNKSAAQSSSKHVWHQHQIYRVTINIYRCVGTPSTFMSFAIFQHFYAFFVLCKCRDTRKAKPYLHSHRSPFGMWFFFLRTRRMNAGVNGNDSKVTSICDFYLAALMISSRIHILAGNEDKWRKNVKIPTKWCVRRIWSCCYTINSHIHIHFFDIGVQFVGLILSKHKRFNCLKSTAKIAYNYFHKCWTFRWTFHTILLRRWRKIKMDSTCQW